jgi:hypothetical protein
LLTGCSPDGMSAFGVIDQTMNTGYIQKGIDVDL